MIGAYVYCLGPNNNGTRTFGMDPVTKEFRIGSRDGSVDGGIWSKVNPENIYEIKVHPGAVLLKIITS